MHNKSIAFTVITSLAILTYAIVPTVAIGQSETVWTSDSTCAWGIDCIGGVPAAALNGSLVPEISFIDDFNRPNSTDISTGAPNPPGSWTSFVEDLGCSIVIENGKLKFNVDTIGCRNSLLMAYSDFDLGNLDHCNSMIVPTIGNWQPDRGPRLGPRLQDFWGGDFFHSGQDGGSKISHFMVMKNSVDTNQWIGAACEIEGGCPAQ